MMKNTLHPRVKKAFEKFTLEAENFFVTKFLAGPSLKKEYSDCLDIMFNLSGERDPGRGIVAYNPRYGQGKSFFFDVVQHRFRRTTGRNLFVKVTARKLCQIYKNAPNNSNPEDELMKFISCKRLFIDDIGDELKDGETTHHYNNKLNVIRWVLLTRYEQWIKKGWITYGTTNLTEQQFGENYDGRVADRILQMTYFKHFEFLGSDQTFRQISETRKLTPEEIAENWKQFEKPKKDVEQIDLELFFNELIAERDEYFENKDNSFWKFVKDYLIRKKLLTKQDLEKVDEKFLDSSELILRRDVRETKRHHLKHTTGPVRNAMIDQALNQITKKEVYDTAENMIARQKFMQLRESKHVFK